MSVLSLKPYTGDTVSSYNLVTLNGDVENELEAILDPKNVGYYRHWEYLVSFLRFNSRYNE